MKVVYYVDIACMIIRKGYFAPGNYGDNHHIPIYNINKHIKDIVLDEYIFDNIDDAFNKLNECIRNKRNSNNDKIDLLNEENSLLFEKLVNYNKDNKMLFEKNI